MIHTNTAKRWLAWLQLTENNTLIVLAVLVGMLTGVGILAFRAGIDLFHTLFVVQLGNTFVGNTLASVGLPRELSAVVVLAIAGGIVGAIMQRFVGHEKYHGVAGVMESVALTGGRLPYWRIVPKAIASALSIGAGASVGPEDPSVQIGSNVGSFVGQRLHLSEERVRLLVSAGSASAIASAFNAPIAGVFFALEVILGEFTASSFGVVVLSAVISAGITQSVRGGSPIFDGLDPFTLNNTLELGVFVFLGVALAIFSLFAIRYHAWQTHAIHILNMPRPLKTALTGALVGAVGAFFPQIMGAGEAFMHSVLSGHSELGVGMIFFLAFLKLIMTAISQGGGFVGGIFAPSLFMGIALGHAYGTIVNSLFSASSPTIYAIAGMAGVMTGIVRAPITAVLIVFEITRDYALILPIMLTAVVCSLVIDRTGTAGIYMMSLIKNGVHLRQGRDVDVMQGVTVREAMMPSSPSIRADQSLVALRDTFREHQTRALCVVSPENERLIGIVTLGDLQRVFESALSDKSIHPETLTVGDICTPKVVTAHVDDVLWTAIRNMGARDIGRLPVVDNQGVVVGMLRRQDIMQAYNVAVAKRLQDQHTAEQIRLHTLTGAHVLEYHIERNSALDNKMIMEIGLPNECVIASIQRRGRLIVPHGNTRLACGDTLTVVADEHSEHLLNALFGRAQ